MSIQKLQRQVAADPRAMSIYLTVDARHGRPDGPDGLADQYFESLQAGDRSGALAIEYAVRQLAAHYCHLAPWRDELERLERHKARGKLGTGAPRMLQDIAGAIERAYAAGDYQAAGGRYTFTIGRLRVSCEARPGAVRILAAKYRRGIGKSRAARYGRALA